jgi:hypothetical protein
MSNITVYTHLILFEEHGYYMNWLSKAAIIMQQQNLVKGRYVFARTRSHPWHTSIVLYLPFTRFCYCLMIAAFDS